MAGIENIVYARIQEGGAERLGYERVCTCLIGFHTRFRGSFGSNHHQRYEGCFFVGFQCLGHGYTVHLGHHYIADNHIGLQTARFFKALGPVISRNHGIPVGKHLAYIVDNIHIVFNHEYRRFSLRLGFYRNVLRVDNFCCRQCRLLSPRSLGVAVFRVYPETEHRATARLAVYEYLAVMQFHKVVHQGKAYASSEARFGIMIPVIAVKNMVEGFIFHTKPCV